MNDVLEYRQAEDASQFDREALVDQVWRDMSKTVPRPVVARTIAELVANYDDAALQRPARASMRREASELLRSAHLTEIEAKFRVTGPQVLWHLQTSTELAGYTMSPPTAKPVWDTYLDTSRRRLLGAGFSCRQRETRDGLEMTLKSLSRAEGAVYRRGEWQVSLSASRPPAKWPESQVRDRVLHIVGQESLQPLFKLEQIRVNRLLRQETRPVAKLSIDSVTVADGDRVSVFHVLEVELLPANSEAQLTAIVECLQDSWRLEPEPYSKFERALTLLDARDGKAGGRFSL